MITYALRIWEVRGISGDAPGCLYETWPAAADAIKRAYHRGLRPVVELVPCVNVLGRILPLILAGGGLHWSSMNRAWTVGGVDDDGGVRCEVPGWMQDGAT